MFVILLGVQSIYLRFEYFVGRWVWHSMPMEVRGQFEESLSFHH